MAGAVPLTWGGRDSNPPIQLWKSIRCVFGPSRRVGRGDPSCRKASTKVHRHPEETCDAVVTSSKVLVCHGIFDRLNP
jgi:hypothetical protein